MARNCGAGCAHSNRHWYHVTHGQKNVSGGLSWCDIWSQLFCDKGEHQVIMNGRCKHFEGNRRYKESEAKYKKWRAEYDKEMEEYDKRMGVLNAAI